jgi:hypothetical protein
MAKQKGIIKIEGTLGDITFVRTQDGYIAKEKTSVNAKRINSDPSFQRTRENNAEFGKAGKAGKLLRMAVRTLMQNAKDSKVTSRLTKELMKVVKADAISARGLRNVMDGEVELLKNFEFNANAMLSRTLFAKYQTSIDRVTGVLTVSLPSFIAKNDLIVPDGATHYKIVSSGTAINFQTETFEEDVKSSDILEWNTIPTVPITLSNQVTANNPNPLFLLVGIQFFQRVNGVDYPLKNGAFNPLVISEVSGM